MLKQTRRKFLKTISAAGFGVYQVLTGTNICNGSERSGNSDVENREKKLISKIRIAQVKVYPEKGNMRANHNSLMSVLADIEKDHKVDVVVTPEGFLDGYVSTEKSVSKDDMLGMQLILKPRDIHKRYRTGPNETRPGYFMAVLVRLLTECLTLL